MNFAKELCAPFVGDALEHNIPVFGRVRIGQTSDVEQFLALNHDNKTALLFKDKLDIHPTRMDHTYFQQLVLEHVSVAKSLFDAGVRNIVIAADNDGALQKILSPRYFERPIRERMQPLLDIYAAIQGFLPEVGVLLTVEELAPGGMDPTDGVFVASHLAELGLKHIIATSGTKDFMPLYDRRTTKKKSRALDDFRSNEPGLSVALWLINHTNLNVSCFSYIDDRTDALRIAKAIGITNLIERAQIGDI